MKNIILILCLAAISCKPDPCENLVCAHDEPCVNGECFCSPPYIGAECSEHKYKHHSVGYVNDSDKEYDASFGIEGVPDSIDKFQVAFYTMDSAHLVDGALGIDRVVGFAAFTDQTVYMNYRGAYGKFVYKGILR